MLAHEELQVFQHVVAIWPPFEISELLLRGSQLQWGTKLIDTLNLWTQEVKLGDFQEILKTWVPHGSPTHLSICYGQVLHSRVIGQNEAVTAVAKAVRRARAGLKPDSTSEVGDLI